MECRDRRFIEIFFSLCLNAQLMTYAETIDYLYQMQRHGVRPGLARMTTLLALFEQPQHAFKSVHIAGTNGKGSTAAMVAAVLEQAGYRVGLYTSPHLLDFSERIRINQCPISHEDIIALTRRLRDKLEKTSPRLAKRISFFEFTTGLAFLYFAQQAVDVAVIEVGLGGRFDATNLVKPLVASITNIEIDHEQYLGTTISEIAQEKAGIIKEAVPLISTASQPEVISIIEEMARLKKAPLAKVGRAVPAASSLASLSCPLTDPIKLSYSGLRDYIVEVPLLGKHQVKNTTTSLGILESLQDQGLHISENDIVEGLKKVRLEGRLEIIQKEPLILMDGAHNPAGARALGEFLEETDPEHRGKHWLISGIMADKKIADMMSPLLAWTDEFVLTRPKIDRAADPQEIGTITAALLNRQGDQEQNITIKENVNSAIAHVKSQIKPQDLLVITGSFYTVGEAKGALTGTPPSLIRG